MKIILCLALGMVVLSGGAWLWVAKTKESRQQTAADIQRVKVKNEGLVRDRYRKAIESAKEEGKNEVILPGGISIGVSQQSLEELLRDNGLLRVRVIDKETTVSEHDAYIRTWYKVEIVETLHHQSQMISGEPLSNEAPSRLLPLLPLESLLVVSGGVVTVDGVKVVQSVSTDGNHYIPKEEYLIVAYLDHGGKLITPVTGRAGVFRINNTRLKSFGQKEHRLVREIEERYGNDLNRLRSNQVSGQSERCSRRSGRALGLGCVFYGTVACYTLSTELWKTPVIERAGDYQPQPFDMLAERLRPIESLRITFRIA